MQLYKYVDGAGRFDYDRYRRVQIEGNRRKINKQWVQEPTIEYLSSYVRAMVGTVSFGICHGTRRGAEQTWFADHLGCTVIGTEISDTASTFPNTLQ